MNIEWRGEGCFEIATTGGHFSLITELPSRESGLSAPRTKTDMQLSIWGDLEDTLFSQEDAGRFVIAGPGEYELKDIFVSGIKVNFEKTSIKTAYLIKLEEISIGYLGEITKKEILIQTRKPEQKIFNFAIKGNLADFYKDEIKKRKQFNYPPFCVFVKITVIGTADKVAKETEYMKKLLKDYGILTYPPSIKADKGKYIMRGLLRVERNKWPHKEIVEILRSLPPHFSVDVDTESLL